MQREAGTVVKARPVFVKTDRSDRINGQVRVGIGYAVDGQEKLIWQNLSMGGETSERQENYSAMQLANLLKQLGEVDLELTQGERGVDIFVPRAEQSGGAQQGGGGGGNSFRF